MSTQGEEILTFYQALDAAEARLRLTLPPVRSLTREEAARLYPGRAISLDYGKAKATKAGREGHPWGAMTRQPRQERMVSGAVGGTVAPRAGQEAEIPEKIAPPVARDSNRQNGDGLENA
jgi:hypothetical protein